MITKQHTKKNKDKLVNSNVLLVLISFFACFAVETALATDQETMELAGQWSFKIDSQGVGEQERWFDRKLPDTINLPGSTDENKKGRKTTEAHLRHLTRVYEYIGPAWYQREIIVPESWEGKRIVLFLERCHWETKVWLDGKPFGTRGSLSTPHVYDFEVGLLPGKHILTVCIDNTIKDEIDSRSHALTEETQSNWNGIVGKLELRATSPVWIDDVQIYPNVEGKKVNVDIKVGNMTGKSGKGILMLSASSRNTQEKHAVPDKTYPVSWTKDDGEARLEYVLGSDALLWDEFNPALYELTITLESEVGDRNPQAYKETFGLRQITTKGKHILLNGRRIQLRGTLECAVFPKTGYPPTNKEDWHRIFAIIASYGLNHMRFHSWCPPEAAFESADEMGIILQAEPSMFHAINKWTGPESREILKEYGNHPSFCLMAMGNEQKESPILDTLVEEFRKTDPRRLYTSSSGRMHNSDSDYYVGSNWDDRPFRYRIASLYTKASSDINFDDVVEPIDRPVVAHEAGQYCMYPNFGEISKYDGVLRARNFEGFRDSLAAKHMLGQAHDFHKASGKLISILYKSDIESMLRSKTLSGFQLLDLHDFPGQGTALVGILDAFWDSKNLIEPGEFRRFCNRTVPLLLLPKFTWTVNEVLEGRTWISHYGPEDLQEKTVYWNLKQKNEKMIASGEFTNVDIKTRMVAEIGDIRIPLAQLSEAQKLIFQVGIKNTEYANTWEIWVYPENTGTTIPSDILVTRKWSTKVEKTLEENGKVLLFPGLSEGGAHVRFAPVQWNAQMATGQIKSMGILCNAKHPALKFFPTESHSNWQWWELLSKEHFSFKEKMTWRRAFMVSSEKSLILNDTPEDYRPIVQVVDDYNRNDRLGLIMEARVRNGKLLVCTLDLYRDMDKRPAARQLFHSLLEYMKSKDFDPTHTLNEDIFKNAASPAFLSSYGALIKCDSEASGYEAVQAFDGNKATIWCSPWKKDAPGFPHELQIDLLRRRNQDPIFNNPWIPVKGFTYTPRQDNAQGRTNEYEFYVSRDGVNWGRPVAIGRFPNTGETQTVKLNKTYRGKSIRFVAKTGYSKTIVSIAELDIIVE